MVAERWPSQLSACSGVTYIPGTGLEELGDLRPRRPSRSSIQAGEVGAGVEVVIACSAGLHILVHAVSARQCMAIYPASGIFTAGCFMKASYCRKRRRRDGVWKMAGDTQFRMVESAYLEHLLAYARVERLIEEGLLEYLLKKSSQISFASYTHESNHVQSILYLCCFLCLSLSLFVSLSLRVALSLSLSRSVLMAISLYGTSRAFYRVRDLFC